MHYQLGNMQLAINPFAAFLLTMNPLFKSKFSLPANILSAMKCITIEKINVKSIIKQYLMSYGLKLSKK